MRRDIRKVLNCEVVKLPTKAHDGAGGNTTIIAAYVPYKRVAPVLLFSHGNAVDLGQMLPFYRSVCLRHIREAALVCQAPGHTDYNELQLANSCKELAAWLALRDMHASATVEWQVHMVC